MKHRTTAHFSTSEHVRRFNKERSRLLSFGDITPGPDVRYVNIILIICRKTDYSRLLPHTINFKPFNNISTPFLASEHSSLHCCNVELIYSILRSSCATWQNYQIYKLLFIVVVEVRHFHTPATVVNSPFSRSLALSSRTRRYPIRTAFVQTAVSAYRTEESLKLVRTLKVENIQPWEIEVI